MKERYCICCAGSSRNAKRNPFRGGHVYRNAPGTGTHGQFPPISREAPLRARCQCFMHMHILLAPFPERGAMFFLPAIRPPVGVLPPPRSLCG